LIRQHSIKLQDERIIAFSEIGDPEGTPIFYFGGFPGSSRLEASRFHEMAVTNRYRIIGIDRPGMGLSSLDINRSILSWADDVERVADYLKIEKFSVIGHSGGGPFVAACAYVFPQRLTGAAIVSGMAPLDNPESKIGMTRGQIISKGLIKTIPWLAPLMMKVTLMMLKTPRMMEKAIKQLPDVDQAIFRDPEVGNALIKCSLEAFRNGVAGPACEMKILMKPWGFDLEKIKFPITIWHGALDTQSPLSHAKIYANTIPGSQLKILENEGHLSVLINHIEEIFKDVST
jgi:pimeloyl-ACP methyl ester carboxylesterase